VESLAGDVEGTSVESLPLRQGLPKRLKERKVLCLQWLRTARWYTRVVHMTLPMARPQKHPQSGVYWLRKRVPDDLRQLVGKREEKRSLGTRNPEEAKRRHGEVLSEIEAQWANLRRGTRSLTQEEIESVAALLCSYYVARFGNNGAANVRAALESQSGDTLWSKGDIAKLLEELPPTSWYLQPVDPRVQERRAPPSWPTLIYASKV
jgi:hypothetical protein